MPISNLELNANNLNQSGLFNVQLQPPPYNRLYFNANSASLSGKKIALQKIDLYRSWASITGVNNTFSISFPTGASAYSDFNITIPINKNFETIDELNDFLQTAMIANKLYLINSTTGDYLYWLRFTANPTDYGVSLIQTLVPTSLPSGYTAPSGFPGYPSVSRTMRFITDASEFNLIIGFAASSTYSGGASIATFNSTFCPQLNPVSSVRVCLNIANNPLALNNDPALIYSFTAKNTEWGAIMSIEPNNLVWYDINTSSSQIQLYFTDQMDRPLNIRDPNISVILLISE